MTATELIRLFHGNPRRRTQLVRCVAHDDRAASLSLTDMKTRMRVVCMAGCPKDDILSAVGITWRDLYYEQRGKVDPILRRKREAEERETAALFKALEGAEFKLRLYTAEARFYLRELIHSGRFCDEYHTAVGRARFWNERWNVLMVQVWPSWKKQRIEAQV